MFVGSPVIDIGIFAAFVVMTSAVALRIGRRDHPTPEDDPSFGARRSGVPVAAEQLYAVAFLGIAGAVAVYGHGGLPYAFGFLVAWLMALLLIAELLRDPGRFARAQVLSARLQERPIRAATATATLAVSFFFLIAQTVAAASLVSLLLELPYADTLGRAVATAVTGAVMIAYTLVGGMRATAGAQIVKAGLLLLCAAVLVTWVMGTYGWSLSALLDAAVDTHRGGSSPAASAALSGQQLLPGLPGLSKIDLLSSGFALVVGAAGLPHVLRRLATPSETGRTRRGSVVWTVGSTGVFCLFSLVLGYGAASLVPGGARGFATVPGASNSAAPLLAYELGGWVLLALISAAAFATILDAAAGLTITASVAFAHDIRAARRHPARSIDEVRIARRTAVILGVVAVGAGILARNQNVVQLLALAFAVAASANLPTLLLSLFWRPFTVKGAQWSSYGGLSCCLVLILFSPTVSGQPTSLLPGVDFALFPLANPALVSIPLSFLLGLSASYLGGLRRTWALARIAAQQAALDRDPPTEAILYDPVARLLAARQMYEVWPAAADPAQDPEAFTHLLPTVKRRRSRPSVRPGSRHVRPPE